MKPSFAAVLLAASVLLTGCVAPPQRQVALKPELMASKVRIGVAMSPLPKVDTEFPGAGCLLCLAAASVANNALTTHVQTLKAEDLLALKNDVAELLQGKGLQARVIDEPIDSRKLTAVSEVKQNFARVDFSALKAKYGIDKLFFIDITAVGVWRNYASYIPTAEPKATVQGAAFVVDLATGALDWYEPLALYKAADRKWDEPPAFPGMTNAYYQALEAAKDRVTAPFSK